MGGERQVWEGKGWDWKDRKSKGFHIKCYFRNKYYIITLNSIHFLLFKKQKKMVIVFYVLHSKHRGHN